MSGFERFKEELWSKEMFYGWLTNKKSSDNKYEDALKIWNAFKLKTMKDYYKLLHHY